MEKKGIPQGIKERLDYNADFALDWHDANEATDGYQLKWIGKDYARLLYGTAAESTVVPDKEHNEKAENKESGNILFSGDNIEVLRHLQAAYHEAVDMIYIDPPYNTGAEFVYADHFEYTDDELQDMLGMSSAQIRRLHSINGRSSHSAWLTFMYPRLRLARELLKESGVIFISIDDNEQANLRLLCDEVFGEGNFVAQLVWERAFSPKNDAKFVSNSHDYVLMYAKQIDLFTIGRLPRTEDANARYANPDNDPRGVWMSSDISVKTYTAEYDYPITTPSGRVVEPPSGRCWRHSRQAFEEKVKDNRIWFGDDGNGVPRAKRFLSELKFEGMAPTSILFYKDVGHSQEGAQELTKLLGVGVFDGPKPVRLVERILRLANLSPDSLILDFFAGSGTTAHAVMALNAEDGGRRQWILAQLDEPTRADSEARRAGYETIDQITMARIAKAEKAIQKKADENTSLFNNNGNSAESRGFRHYYVRPLPNDTIDAIEEFDGEEAKGAHLALGEMAGMLGGEAAVLNTFMLSDGARLTEKVERLDLAGYSAPLAGQRVYILESGWGTEQTAALLNIIGKRERAINAVVLWGYAGLDFAAVKELELGVRQAFGEGDVRVTFSIRW